MLSRISTFSAFINKDRIPDEVWIEENPVTKKAKIIWFDGDDHKQERTRRILNTTPAAFSKDGCMFVDFEAVPVGDIVKKDSVNSYSHDKAKFTISFCPDAPSPKISVSLDSRTHKVAQRAVERAMQLTGKSLEELASFVRKSQRGPASEEWNKLNNELFNRDVDRDGYDENPQLFLAEEAQQAFVIKYDLTSSIMSLPTESVIPSPTKQ